MSRIDIARAVYEAFATGDREMVERVFADDFTFSAPPDPLLDRDGYFERCWPGAGFGGAFQFVRLIESGDEVIVTYERTRPDGGRGRNTEVLTFRGDQIARAEVYFGWDVLKLELDRTFSAPAPAVFEAFTDPEQLARWWGPEGFTIPRLDFEPRPGAPYRIEMQPPEGDSFHLKGEFREVDPPARIAFTFVWEPADADDVETLASLSFEDLGESTRVAFTQSAFKTEERRELHRGGWTESFDKLERFLARRA